MKFKSIIIPGCLFLIFILNNPIFSGQIFLHPNNLSANETKTKPAEFKIYKPSYLEKKSPGQYSKQDWATIIDATWGSGLPTDQKLAIFDRAWNLIDQGYGAFMNLNVNIDSLRDLYRPGIEAGVSRGRFAAIMNYLSFALKDGHTNIVDSPLNWETPIQPGVPLFIISAAIGNDHFGACLTPLPDSSLLVYKSLRFHKLGLVPGDIVLGYDGIPWKTLYKQLLEAQLPICPMYVWGSSDESMTHILLQCAGLNWHLFDTIDIIKYSTGDTVHLSTSLLLNQRGNIWGNEQLPVAGVPFPDVYNEDYISWGIIDGTSIGYIYIWSWYWWLDISEQFYDAVYNLMYNYETTGMIIDSRLNYGGNMQMADAGYSLLFNETLQKVAFDNRGNPDDHFDMVPSTTHPDNLWIIRGDPTSFYDKPIAILFGPNTVSNGDWESVRMQFHPMVRSFGKSSNGAFTISDTPDLGNADWHFNRAVGSGYLIEGHQYMAHKTAPVDEKIWLTRDDVAKGEDTVVKAAMNWIQNLVFAYEPQTDRKYVKSGIDSINIIAKVNNPNLHDIGVWAFISNQANELIDSTMLYDDGSHNDDLPDDGLRGCYWQIPEHEQHFSYNIKVTDFESGLQRTEKNISKFTSIGPIVIDGYIPLSADTLPNPGDVFPIKLKLKNLGTETVASNIYIGGDCQDSAVTEISTTNNSFPDIPPGETVTSTGIYVIKFADDFQCGRAIPFEVNIYSDDFLFWKDTLKIYIYPTNVSQRENGQTPKYCRLNQNYPNPFNNTTRISYQLPEKSSVQLIIYNTLGQEIRTLVNANQPPGYYKMHWDGTNDSGDQVVSGLYIYQLKTRNHLFTQKMLHLK